jgi:hypothetical protein
LLFRPQLHPPGTTVISTEAAHAFVSSAVEKSAFLYLPKLFFFKFSPKIACQAPFAPNSFQNNKIRLAISFTPTGIIKIEIKKSSGQAGAFVV